MKEWNNKRSVRKKRIVEQVKQDKNEMKQRKEAINQLPEGERKEAKAQLKATEKEKKQARKKEIASLDKTEKKMAKKEQKIYKKIKRRPQRAIGWSIAALLVGTVVVKFGPTVMDMADTMSGKGIELKTGTKEGKLAREEGEALSEKIADEGIVLLKNEGDSLPLKDKKTNVFGVSSFNFRYGGGGSGGSDTSRAINLYQGLEDAGISYNKELKSFYEGLPEVKEQDTGAFGLMQIVKSMTSKGDHDEPEVAYLTDEAMKQAKDYSDNALIVIASSGVESSDMSSEDLKITKNMEALIKKVTKEFENVTVVVNAGNTLELGLLEEYPQIKSIVWTGTPGPYGARSLGNVLAGKTNPSGRLVDTYAYDVDSAPATENFGSYAYDNLDKNFINYEEGIYIGYRFYETYYEGQEEAYQKAVQYPYGYGLSYTDFDWKIVKKDFNQETISMDVEVTNTGNVEGKDVVQLYYSAPYYPGEIEKAAIELGAYQKTKSLKPGEKEVVTLTYSTNDMSSYDMNKEQAFVLDQGDYQIKLGKNVHDIVATETFNQKEKLVIKQDSATGTEIKNLFENSDTEDMTYLSRQDWDKTYPSDKDINHTAPDFVLEESNKKTTDSKLDMPEVGVDKEIKLADLKGVAYDDPKWQTFMSQFTIEELMNFYTQGAYKTNPVDRLGVPSTVLLDGPAGINFFFKPVEAASYPTEVVLSSTWNDELAYDMGAAVGKEAKAMGVNGWYAPAMNIHRTAKGGRNFEYFSEDPLLSGKMASAVTRGTQDQGVMVFMKHFAMNDQETHARSGLYVWSNEQAMREVHLRPFEISVKEGQNIATMSSFSYINGQWAGANSILLNDLLRDEWGFEGMVSSDAVFGFMHADKAVVSGNDLMLDIMSKSANKKRLEKAYKVDPSGITVGLQTSVKNVMYSILQTYLFD
ncbi:glycoside hydrolase family 3 C-terminal domain-containing protein [Vagococcus sp. DIV0080]|uniref:Glycoside hydrolase family 3 C-terminal domain-containing protein n=1 Tax=Candidatus Vagococcus giribetii TaxID=2230876 RepID=A0ABS3HWZ0_9ENTE|nr:glycoside hydrolase family 3 protein [Vagococcus sp. DIV0080]MBO0477648.1 glycoside hydrolase family 3 C-terminal domain-containing protein [Vagococcus sp. DIV0080]